MHVHFDCIHGAAGDMLLAACLDAAATTNTLQGDETTSLLLFQQQVEAALRTVLPADEFSLHVKRVHRSAGKIAARHVTVTSKYLHAAAPVPTRHETTAPSHDEEDVQYHDHSHHHHHHAHAHDRSFSQDSHDHTSAPAAAANDAHNHGHAHHRQQQQQQQLLLLRNLPDIVKLLHAATGISAWVRDTAIKVFTCLARAEAAVHGAESIESVHFHEVGAVDSIVDTVGTLIAIDLLVNRDCDSSRSNDSDAEKNNNDPSCPPNNDNKNRTTATTTTFSCSALPMGQGVVQCAHGRMPVPAPATLYLLRDMTVRIPGVNVWGEVVTPTAASLLKVLCNNDNDAVVVNGMLRHVGMGAGTKDFDGHPNIVRVLFLEK